MNSHSCFKNKKNVGMKKKIIISIGNEGNENFLISKNEMNEWKKVSTIKLHFFLLLTRGVND
jgi:hypothetical protein